MDKIALYAGNFLIKAFKYMDAGILAEVIEEIGVTTVGYVTIVTIIILILVVFITKGGGLRWR